MASKVLQYSAETPSIMDPIHLKNQMNDSILNSEEITDDEAMEDVTPCSSAKKKAVSRKKLFGSQDEEYDKKYSDSENDDLSDMTSCKDGEENAEAKNKRKASTSSDDDEDNMWVHNMMYKMNAFWTKKNPWLVWKWLGDETVVLAITMLFV